MDPNNNPAGVPDMQNQPVDSVQLVAPTGAETIEQALAEANMEVASKAGVPMGAPVKKSGHGMLIGLILCLLLAISGIGFGVYVMMDGNTQKTNYEKQISTLKAQNKELADKIAELTNGIEEEAEDDYLYVEEFGLKIKKTENFPDMTVEVVDQKIFKVKMSASAEEGTPNVVSFLKVPTCDDYELTLGYSNKIEIVGGCLVMSEILPYGQDPEYPLTPFLEYMLDDDNFLAI